MHSIHFLIYFHQSLPAGLPIVRLSPDGTGVVGLPNVYPGISMADSSEPRIERLYPANAVAGSEFNPQPGGHNAIAVAGSNFSPGATVLFDARPLETTYGRSTFLSAIVPKELTSRASTVAVTIRNPDGRSSPSVPFDVTPRSGGR